MLLLELLKHNDVHLYSQNVEKEQQELTVCLCYECQWLIKNFLSETILNCLLHLFRNTQYFKTLLMSCINLLMSVYGVDRDTHAFK